MVCIYCHSKTTVTNSRPQVRLNHIWRRRKCEACGSIFTTLEMPDLTLSLMVHSMSALKAFSRDKLFLSIYDSLKHRKTALRDATALTDTIISKLYPAIHNGKIEQNQIVTVASQTLKLYDKAAATHYHAYHPLLKDRS